MCLLGSMGGGATSSRQVMAVLSSQGRGDAETLPSVVSRGTAQHNKGTSLCQELCGQQTISSGSCMDPDVESHLSVQLWRETVEQVSPPLHLPLLLPPLLPHDVGYGASS